VKRFFNLAAVADLVSARSLAIALIIIYRTQLGRWCTSRQPWNINVGLDDPGQMSSLTWNYASFQLFSNFIFCV